jgi:hypothetical protein
MKRVLHPSAGYLRQTYFAVAAPAALAAGALAPTIHANPSADHSPATTTKAVIPQTSGKDCRGWVCIDVIGHASYVSAVDAWGEVPGDRTASKTLYVKWGPSDGTSSAYTVHTFPREAWKGWREFTWDADRYYVANSSPGLGQIGTMGVVGTKTSGAGSTGSNSVWVNVCGPGASIAACGL